MNVATIVSHIKGTIESNNVNNPLPLNETPIPPLVRINATAIARIQVVQGAGYAFMMSPKRFLATQPMQIIPSRGGIIIKLKVGLNLYPGNFQNLGNSKPGNKAKIDPSALPSTITIANDPTY